MVEISSQKVLVFRLCPYLLLVSQSHVEDLIVCAFFVYFGWQSTQDFSRTLNFIIYQLESSDRLTILSSLYSSKGRTFRKVMGGGGAGRGIFEPQEFFFRYQIPCMNFY